VGEGVDWARPAFFTRHHLDSCPWLAGRQDTGDCSAPVASSQEPWPSFFASPNGEPCGDRTHDHLIKSPPKERKGNP